MIEVEKVPGGLVKWSIFAAAGALLFVTSDHAKTPFDGAFDLAGKRHNVDPNLLRAIARRESSFDPNAIGDHGTSFGLGQIHIPTAHALGADLAKLLDPVYNADVMAQLLDRLRTELGQRFSPDAWVAAYNAGSPAVLRRGLAAAVPGYVADVTFNWRLYGVGRMLVG